MKRTTMVFLILAVGCGDDSGGGGVDGPGSSDARIDTMGPTPDAPVDSIPACATPTHVGPCRVDVEQPPGTAFKAYVYTYDASGRLTELLEDNISLPDNSWNYTYDGTSTRITQIDYDAGDDGVVIDTVETFTYDTGGHQTLYEKDDLADPGDVDFAIASTWDGELIDYQEIDFDGDGTFDMHEEYTYDANEDLILIEDSFGPTVVTTVTQTFDTMHNRLTRDIDEDNSGSADTLETWTYDATCRQTRHELEDVDAPANDLIETFTYDAGNNIATEDTDLAGDGSIDRHRIYGYACF